MLLPVGPCKATTLISANGVQGGIRNDSNYYFIYNRAAGYGYSNTLPRNQVTLAQTYEIPVGKGRKYMSSMNRLADGAIGGWTLSGATTFYRGLPFSPTFGNHMPGNPVPG